MNIFIKTACLVCLILDLTACAYQVPAYRSRYTVVTPPRYVVPRRVYPVIPPTRIIVPPARIITPVPHLHYVPRPIIQRPYYDYRKRH